MARPWIWTPPKEQAVEALASRRLSQRQVAETIGVTRRAIEGWMRRPVFRERVERERAAYARRVRQARAARLAAWRAAEDARAQAEEDDFQRRLTAISHLSLDQRARAMRALLRPPR